MFINQIFELSMEMDKEKFKKVLRNHYNVSGYEENEEEYIDQSLSSDGITIIFRKSQYKKKVKIIADFRLLLGNNKMDADKLIQKLNKYIGRYFDSKYHMHNFTLSGMTLAVNIDVHKHENVSEYLKVLHRIGKVKGFSPIYLECFDNGKVFYLNGNSNGIQFLVYDLENLLKTQLGATDIGRKKLKLIVGEARGILRAEVRLTKPKAIRSYSVETDIPEQIVELLKNCQNIFMDTFTHIIPFGDFYKKDKATEIIHKNVKDCIMRRKMLQLLTLIPEKKSLYLAQKSMNCRSIEKVMDAFAKINMSPVTISKRQDIKYLKNIYFY